MQHAIRFTSPNVAAGYTFPASHLVRLSRALPTSSPPLGTRARLRASFDCNARLRKSRAARIICVALKTYGLVLADVGSPFFLTGEASGEWERLLRMDDLVADLRRIRGSDFEIVVAAGAHARRRARGIVAVPLDDGAQS